MKPIVFGILFIFSIVWGWNTIGEYSASSKNEIVVTESETSEATHHIDQIISVLTAANSYADVSVRTPNFLSTNFVRRYRPAGFSFDKLYIYLTEGQGILFDNTYKLSLGLSQEYAARLKYAGYYIYNLRKIII